MAPFPTVFSVLVNERGMRWKVLNSIFRYAVNLFSSLSPFPDLSSSRFLAPKTFDFHQSLTNRGILALYRPLIASPRHSNPILKPEFAEMECFRSVPRELLSLPRPDFGSASFAFRKGCCSHQTEALEEYKTQK